jgi:hypothetical protein
MEAPWDSKRLQGGVEVAQQIVSDAATAYAVLALTDSK